MLVTILKNKLTWRQEEQLQIIALSVTILKNQLPVRILKQLTGRQDNQLLL